MKKLLITGAFSMLLAAAYAQETVLDTAQNPVRQGDPAVTQSSDQVRENNLRDMVKISESEIPADMVNALLGLLILTVERERYAVRIATAEGEKNAVVSEKKEYIAQIVEALNEVFSHNRPPSVYEKDLISN